MGPYFQGINESNKFFMNEILPFATEEPQEIQHPWIEGMGHCTKGVQPDIF